jgi:hypothetical protein
MMSSKKNKFLCVCRHKESAHGSYGRALYSDGGTYYTYCMFKLAPNPDGDFIYCPCTQYIPDKLGYLVNKYEKNKRK